MVDNSKHYLIFSDLHGNLANLELMLAQVDSHLGRKPDGYWCLGDLLDGPNERWCLYALQTLNPLIFLNGNHEIRRREKEKREDVDKKERTSTSESAISYSELNPLSPKEMEIVKLNYLEIVLVHGSPIHGPSISAQYYVVPDYIITHQLRRLQDKRDHADLNLSDDELREQMLWSLISAERVQEEIHAKNQLGDTNSCNYMSIVIVGNSHLPYIKSGGYSMDCSIAQLSDGMKTMASPIIVSPGSISENRDHHKPSYAILTVSKDSARIKIFELATLPT